LAATVAETYGLAAEIRNLELKLNKRHDKAVKALKTRIDELEAIVGKLGAWVASKQRAEAQEKVDASSVIHKRDETGEPWLTPTWNWPKECRYCNKPMALGPDHTVHCTGCGWEAFPR